MQGSKHLTQTLGLTALLVLMTIQATGVDSLPQDVNALTNGGSGTQFKNGKSSRSIGQPSKWAPDNESSRQQPADKPSGNDKERPVSKSRGQVPVANSTGDTLRVLVSIALGTLNGYKDTLRKTILDSIGEIAVPVVGAAFPLHHRKILTYGSRNDGTGSPSSEGQPSKKTSVLVSFSKLPLVDDVVNKGRRVREAIDGSTDGGTGTQQVNAVIPISEGRSRRETSGVVSLSKRSLVPVPVEKRRPARKNSGRVPPSRAIDNSMRRVVSTALVRLDGDKQALRKAILQIIEEADARPVKGSGGLGYHRKKTQTRNKNVAVF